MHYVLILTIHWRKKFSSSSSSSISSSGNSSNKDGDGKEDGRYTGYIPKDIYVFMCGEACTDDRCSNIYIDYINNDGQHIDNTSGNILRKRLMFHF